MKKFEITSIDEDTYKISSLVNGESLTFKKNVELARKIQNVNANARIKMIKYMKENNIKKEDLIDKRIENGKTYYDESSYRLIENGFIQDEGMLLFTDIFKTLFNKRVDEVLSVLGFEDSDSDEGYRLGEELRDILLENKIPRKSNQ